MLRGKTGDDRIFMGDDSFVLAEGGDGTDTVAVDFALDLTNGSDDALSGIESLDLGGNSAAAMILGVDDVVAATSVTNALTETENTLVIRGGAEGAVTVVGEEWEISSDQIDTDGDLIEESYTVYSDATSGATVFVESLAVAA